MGKKRDYGGSEDSPDACFGGLGSAPTHRTATCAESARAAPCSKAPSHSSRRSRWHRRSSAQVTTRPPATNALAAFSERRTCAVAEFPPHEFGLPGLQNEVAFRRKPLTYAHGALASLLGQLRGEIKVRATVNLCVLAASLVWLCVGDSRKPRTAADGGGWRELREVLF